MSDNDGNVPLAQRLAELQKSLNESPKVKPEPLSIDNDRLQKALFPNSNAVSPPAAPSKRLPVSFKKEDEHDDDDDAPIIPSTKKLKSHSRDKVKHSLSKESSPQDTPVKVKKEKAHDGMTATTNDEPTLKKSRSKQERSHHPRKIKKEPSNHPVQKIKQEDSPIKSSQSAKSETEDNDDQDGEEFKWWEQNINQNEDDKSAKWTTLHHNGLYFPPEYIPHGIPMRYNSQTVQLHPAVEEVASFWAALVETDHAQNPIFRANFFADWRQVIAQHQPEIHSIITDLDSCDFSHITNHLNLERERKRSLSKEEKEVLKQEKLQLEEQYGYCMLDGHRERVGNFRVEPPGLFRGRGQHPKAGKLKLRVQPEQVTINISRDAPIPPAPPGHQWQAVVHDPTVTWLATWTENINRDTKYVFLAPSSSLKGQSDLRKFETARALHRHVGHIRAINAEELHSKEMAVRQRATALWLIDRLALRAGNEKGDDEADTVGCCSLRREHVRLQPPNTVVFDFLGKDSIRYLNEVSVDDIIFKNLAIFMRPPKEASDLIFDRLNTSKLNKYLTTLMPGLTAKVFRTYNASHTFQSELIRNSEAVLSAVDTSIDTAAKTGLIPELILAYNRANRQVAVLCNHQRAVAKTHSVAMEKLEEKILQVRYDRHLVRQAMHQLASNKEIKKSDAPDAAVSKEPGIDAAAIKRIAHERAAALEEQQQSNGDDDDGGETAASSNAEKKTTRKAPAKLPNTLEKLAKKFNQLTARLNNLELQHTERDENKTTALGTSKTNYIDPRITAAWCKKYNVPVEKLFTKTLREKFKWAMDVDPDWHF